MSRNETKNRIDHMLLDTDFFEKPENVEAVDRFGDLAPAAILRLCLKLMNEREARIKRSQAVAMWRSSGTDIKVWNEIISYYVDCGWLIEQDDWICSARIEQERSRVIKKRDQLSANAKQKLSKCSANAEQNGSKSTDTDTDTDLNLNKKEKTTKLPKTKFLEFVFLSAAEVEKFRAELGEPVLTRCIEKLDAWIASDPTIRRRKNGQNAAACFRSWVINSIAEEQGRARAGPAKSGATVNGYGQNHIKNMQTLARLEAEETANGQ